MAGIALNLTFMRGSQFNEQLTITDLSPAGVESPTNLTGATATWVLRNGPNLTDTQLSIKTVGSGLELSNPTGGIMLLKFVTSDTDSLTPLHIYYHHLVIHLADTRIKEVILPSSRLVVTERLVATLP